MLFDNNRENIYIMTSANIADEPIIYKDNDAFERLHTIVDYFVTYNREIIAHTDDSVMYVVDEHPFFVRRSRWLCSRFLHKNSTAYTCKPREIQKQFCTGAGIILSL